MNELLASIMKTLAGRDLTRLTLNQSESVLFTRSRLAMWLKRSSPSDRTQHSWAQESDRSASLIELTINRPSAHKTMSPRQLL